MKRFILFWMLFPSLAFAAEEYVFEFCQCSLPSSGFGNPYFYTICLNDSKGPATCREARCRHAGVCITDEKFILDYN